MNESVIAYKIGSNCLNHSIPYVTDGTGLKKCQVKLRFSTCACV